MTRQSTLTALAGAVALMLVIAACESGSGDAADTGAAAQTAPAQGATAAGDTGFLDPSTATREQLIAVPGMTAAAADALVASRPYENMVAVDRVLAAHLSEAQRDTVYARVWKPIDPTAATEAEILLIPGVGERMAGEFEEYRPWRDAAHFRREIGKYVDSTEVERLLSYTNLR